MTEEEAKKKWCPFARLLRFGSLDAHGPFNRVEIVTKNATSLHNPTTCLASACMAWRWDNFDPHDSKSSGGILLPKEQWPGHCGLAGKP